MADEHHSMSQARDGAGRLSASDSFDAHLAALVKELAPRINAPYPNTAPPGQPLKNPAYPSPEGWPGGQAPDFDLNPPPSPPSAPQPQPGNALADNAQPMNALRGMSGTQSGPQQMPPWMQQLIQQGYGVRLKG